MKGAAMKTLKLNIDCVGSSKKVARISLNKPHNLNAIDIDLYKEIKMGLEMITAREDISILILSSDVSRAFSTGVNVKYIQTLTNEEASQFFNDLSILLNELSHFPIPTIAIVNGYAFGAGADLAISCDLRIATASSFFRFPGPQFGLILGTQRLINEIGVSKTRFLTLTNTKLDARTAQNYGLVHEICVDVKDALEISSKWAETLLNVPIKTAQKIKGLCCVQQNYSHDLTSESVLQEDFKQRFHDYLAR